MNCEYSSRPFTIVGSVSQRKIPSRPPSLLYDRTDDLIESCRDQTTRFILRGKYIGLLGLTESICLLSKKIISTIIDRSLHMLSSLPSSRLLCLRELVAISMYLAFPLEGQPLSLKLVENLFEGASPDFLSTYGIVRQAYNSMIGEFSWKIFNIMLDCTSSSIYVLGKPMNVLSTFVESGFRAGFLYVRKGLGIDGVWEAFRKELRTKQRPNSP